ncbi:MAG: VWA domain-containing protein [Candidatus Nanosalina sp.]
MQVSFTNQYFSLLVLLNGLVLLLFLYSRKKKKKRAMKFGNYSTLEKVTDGSIINNNYLLFLTRIVTLSCLIIGISNPVLVEKVSTPSEDYVLAIDSSASMFTSDIDPTRFEAAKDVAKKFVKRAESPTSVGLISYSGTVGTSVEPDTKKSEVLSRLENLEIGQTPGTNLAQAIRSSTSLLLQSDHGKVILVTDGENTGENSLNSSLTFASSHNVSVYPIGIGRSNGSQTEYRIIKGENVSSSDYPNIDMNQLEMIAQTTGGKAFSVSNRSELETAFLDIGKKRKETDISNLFILFSAGLLVFEWVLRSTDLEVMP